MKEISETSQLENQYGPVSPISERELKVGMIHAARLVRRYGMIYWPIVERLQRESEQIEAREALLDKLLGDEYFDADS